MLIGHPIPEMQLLKTLTFKIQGQGHGWHHSSKLQCESNILLTHIPFVPCQSGIPLLSYDFFKIWPSNSRVRVMDEITVQSHNVAVTSYRLTSLSFHVDRPPIPDIQHFQNLTLKIKGQAHGWGHTLKSQWGSSIVSTRIPFVLCQSGIPFVSYDFFKIWPWKSKVKVMGEVNSSKSQCGSSILSNHILFFPCQSALPFLRYSIFKIWPWKSRVKVMGEVPVQRHNVGLTSYRLTSLSFHVNRPAHSWDTTFSKLDLEYQGSGSYDPDVAQLQV